MRLVCVRSRHRPGEVVVRVPGRRVDGGVDRLDFPGQPRPSRLSRQGGVTDEVADARLHDRLRLVPNHVRQAMGLSQTAKNTSRTAVAQIGGHRYSVEQRWLARNTAISAPTAERGCSSRPDRTSTSARRRHCSRSRWATRSRTSWEPARSAASTGRSIPTRRRPLGHPGRSGRNGRRPAVGLGRRQPARVHGGCQQQRDAVDPARRHDYHHHRRHQRHRCRHR